jgi:hypothetical protein
MRSTATDDTFGHGPVVVANDLSARSGGAPRKNFMDLDPPTEHGLPVFQATKPRGRP